MNSVSSCYNGHMYEKVFIRMKDKDGLRRFEEWCVNNGISTKPHENVLSLGDLQYYFDTGGQYGIYYVDHDDVPLVKLRWCGDEA